MHKVVAVDCCESLNGKLHLRRIADLVTELLHLTAWTWSMRKYFLKCSKFLQAEQTAEDRFCTHFLNNKHKLYIYIYISAYLMDHLCVFASLNWPQDVTIVEFQQHAVLAELCLSGAVDVTRGQVLVHFFETLEALCHVLVVDLSIERWDMLLAEVVSAVNMEACALLDKWHGVWAAQVLLGDVLSVRQKKGWDSKSVFKTCRTISVWLQLKLALTLRIPRVLFQTKSYQSR